MTTPFATVLRRLGLSQTEAAELLGLGPDAVRSMAMGRRRVPSQIWDALSDYARGLEPVEQLIDRARSNQAPVMA